MKTQDEVNELIEHFFRHESGKMIAVLTGLFGTGHILLAEDLVQETLIGAINNWTYKGIPQNPTAWLYTVAKNKALNVIKREKIEASYFSEKEVAHTIQNPLDLAHLFSDANIMDDQLRMMFLCCHPTLSENAQITLILKTICGFNIAEIAKAFFTNTATINKRLVRARKKIREANLPFVLPSKNKLNTRLDTVLEAIYLLFNEGYNASSGDELIRKELCDEAIRLAELLIQSNIIQEKTDTHALLALMQLNSSRFTSRIDHTGAINTLENQNRTLWDMALMEKGFRNLNISSQEMPFSKYHLLAGISAYHCAAKSFENTNWIGILKLYNRLLEIDASSIVLLNRAIVLSKVGKIKEAFQDLEHIEKDRNIQSNYLFYAVKSYVLIKTKQLARATDYLHKAIELAPLEKEKELLYNELKKIA